jgi:hypothetical protein
MVCRHQLSAMQLAGVAVLGSVLASSSFIVPVTSNQRFCSMGWLGRLLLLLPFFAACITLTLMAESRFKDGVRNNRWSEEEIAPVREVLLSPWWTFFSVVTLIASGILMFVSAHSYRDIGWALFVIGQSATRLQTAFRQPTPKNPSGPDWKSFSPIRSEHWGER